VLSVAGGRLGTFEMVASRGQYKAGDPWTVEEIAEHWATLSKR
jgi:hypothetical protein